MRAHLANRLFIAGVLAVLAAFPAAHGEDLYPLMTRSALVADEPLSLGVELGTTRKEAVPFGQVRPSSRCVTEIPRLRVTVPMGNRAVLRADWAFLNLKNVDYPVARTGTVSTPGDPRFEIVGTFDNFKPGHFDVGGVVAVKVPSAKSSNGAGTDQIDLEISALASHGFGGTTGARVHVNAGLFIRDVPNYALDNAGRPVTGRQDDLFRYGLGVSLPWRGWTLLAELHGESASRFHNNYVYLNGGLRVPFAENRWVVTAFAGHGLTNEAGDVLGRIGVVRNF